MSSKHALQFCLVLFASLFGLNACTSVTRHGRNQHVLVRSEPPGAIIFVDGEKKGKTPAFVEVRRGRSRELKLVHGHQEKTVKLNSRYRWGDSFFSNFIFVYFAPIGWVTDLTTGSAWSFRDPGPVPFPGVKGKQVAGVSEGPMNIAIAPPQADTPSVSDQVGKLWQDVLPAHMNQEVSVRPYLRTLPTFVKNGYDYDHRPDKEEENKLFAELEVNKVFESEAVEEDKTYELNGSIRDVYSGEVIKLPPMQATPPANTDASSWFASYQDWLHFVPNTPGLEWSSSDTELRRGGDSNHKATAVYDDSFFSQAQPFLSALNLTRLQPPRRQSGYIFRFQFVPAVRIAYSQIEFSDFQEISTTTFQYLRISAGLGPELGWHYRANYFYFNFIPMLGWHQLRWRSRQGVEEISRGALTTRSELGYRYFLNDHWSLNLFTKTMSSPSGLWNTAIQRVNAAAPQVESGVDISGGIGVGYTFGPSMESRHWRLRQ
ncbi:MAG: PEGA domain-containing protein [Bdellovibrionales bacterium]